MDTEIAIAEKDNIIVYLSWIGEGYSGDYDIEDPGDRKLLRFNILIRGKDGIEVEVPDGSFCTDLALPAPQEKIQKAANLILEAVEDEIKKCGKAKRICENLSWANWKWVDHHKDNPTITLPMDFIEKEKLRDKTVD